ncbi:MAG TPA: hypothetical protein VL974_01325 [Magnetospirillum sp.]|nr:hypothetical protein [Magnetospirillum sp.]
MQAVTAAPAHELLQRKDQADSHSTRKTQRATASMMSTYSFGPMDTSNKSTSGDSTAKGINGIATLHNPLKSHSTSMVTTLQSVDNKA